MKRFTKFVNKDPHPEVPFYDGADNGMPTKAQAAFWAVAAFLAAIIGSYWP